MSGLDPSGIHHYQINFNSGMADTLSVYHSMNFASTNAGICDTGGQILFYSNGQFIINRNFDSLLNSNNFNPGSATNYYLHLMLDCKMNLNPIAGSF